jgi:hypothetical protein
MHGQKMVDMVSGLTQKNCSQRPSGSGMRPGVQAKAKRHAAWSRWAGGFGKTQGRTGPVCEACSIRSLAMHLGQNLHIRELPKALVCASKT